MNELKSIFTLHTIDAPIHDFDEAPSSVPCVLSFSNQNLTLTLLLKMPPPRNPSNLE